MNFYLKLFKLIICLFFLLKKLTTGVESILGKNFYLSLLNIYNAIFKILRML